MGRSSRVDQITMVEQAFDKVQLPLTEKKCWAHSVKDDFV